MNRKGFAATGLLYTLLVIFLVSITIMLYNLQNRKTVLDQVKIDSVEAVEEQNNYDALVLQIEDLKQTVQTLKNQGINVDKVYPIGSIYISTKNENPSTIYPGTEWESFGEGRTLVGTTKTSGETGGSNTVTLTTANLPSHSHIIPALSGTTDDAGVHYHDELHWGSPSSGKFGVNAPTSGTGTWRFAYEYTPGASEASFLTGYGGSHHHSVAINASTTTTCNGCTGSSISVQNPYITVYMYKRTK